MNGNLDDISSPGGLEDDQELWQMLGRARKPEVSPYFARRVLREAASLPQTRPGSALWRGLKAWWQAGLPLLRPPRAAAWSGAFAAVVICAASVMMTFSNGGSTLRLSPVSPHWQQTAPEEEIAPETAAASSADGATLEASLSADRGTAADSAATAADDSTLTQQDAEVIADLDTLMAREETHLWTDDNAAF